MMMVAKVWELERNVKMGAILATFEDPPRSPRLPKATGVALKPEHRRADRGEHGSGDANGVRATRDSGGMGIRFCHRTTTSCDVPSADAARLRAGVDHPRDLSGFKGFFSDDAACVRFLERVRWPQGFVCPPCEHHGKAWQSARGLLRPSCRRRAYGTAGTIFEGTRKPLRVWFIAAWEIVGHKYGANATNVKRMLGANSYETASASR